MKKVRNSLLHVLKMAALVSASIVTAFPFFWMIISALKTKAEIMDVSVFLPETAQWQNFSEVLFESPMVRYIGNSLFVSVCTVAIQGVYGGDDRVCDRIYEISGKKGFVRCDHGNLYASNSGNLYSELYYFIKLEFAEYLYRADHIKCSQYFWDFSSSAGFYAGSGRIRPKRPKLMERMHGKFCGRL